MIANRRRGRGLAAAALALVLAAALFVGGIALGRALEEADPDNGSRTLVRTLRPMPLELEPHTVTVTVDATETPP